MKSAFHFSLAMLVAAACVSMSAHGADQTIPGQGNEEAIRLAKGSPIVQSAFDLLRDRLSEVRSSDLRRNMNELFDYKTACVLYILYSNGGLAAVRREIGKLRKLGIV